MMSIRPFVNEVLLSFMLGIIACALVPAFLSLAAYARGSAVQGGVLKRQLDPKAIVETFLSTGFRRHILRSDDEGVIRSFGPRLDNHEAAGSPPPPLGSRSGREKVVCIEESGWPFRAFYCYWVAEYDEGALYTVWTHPMAPEFSTPPRLIGGIGQFVQNARRDLVLGWSFPFLPIWDRFLGNLLCYGVLAWTLVYLMPYAWRSVLHKRRYMKGMCPHCAYDLRSVAGARCPECGRDIVVGRNDLPDIGPDR